MKPRSAAIIAVRVIALWIGIEILTAVITLIIAEAQHGTGELATAWGLIVTRLLIAFALWTQAARVASAIARDADETGTELPGRAANMHALALSVVGIILATQGLTGLVGSAITSAAPTPFAPSFPSSFGGLFASTRAAAVFVELITLAIGVALLFGSGAFAGYLSRNYPQRETPPPTG